MIANKINDLIKKLLWKRKLELVSHTNHRDFIKLVDKISSKTKIWIHQDENYNLYNLMKRNSKNSRHRQAKRALR